MTKEEIKAEHKKAYDAEGKRRMQLRKSKRNYKLINGYQSRRRTKCCSPWSCRCCSCSDWDDY